MPKLRRKKQVEEPKGRITTDTLAEHRERVLAGGRKFKYPVQYARHKLVINAVIIGVAAIILVAVLGWYMLYPGQNTSDFMYRVTRVLPVPVASVDGKAVRYSEYLMKYRSEAHFLIEKGRVDPASEDGKRQLEFIKTQSMRGAIADTYAAKLAAEKNIKVTDVELEEYIKRQRQSQGNEVSESTYNAVILDYYGWSPDEYRQAMKSKLLRQKVSYAIDDRSREVAKEMSALLAKEKPDLQAIVTDINKKWGKDTAYVTPPTWVPRDNKDYGVSDAATKLKKGEISPVFELTNGDGLTFVRLIDSNDKQIQYEYITIPLTIFDKKVKEIEDGNKLSVYISVSLDATKSDNR